MRRTTLLNVQVMRRLAYILIFIPTVVFAIGAEFVGSDSDIKVELISRIEGRCIAYKITAPVSRHFHELGVYELSKIEHVSSKESEAMTIVTSHSVISRFGVTNETILFNQKACLKLEQDKGNYLTFTYVKAKSPSMILIGRLTKYE